MLPKAFAALLPGSRAARPHEPPGIAKPSEEEIRRQLERIIASPAFETSQRNRRFLRYVVEETLAGRADRIKAYSIATVVFERDQDFDPQTDPIIRIEASRLRRALDHYYLAGGRDDAVCILVPKGSYVPLFDYAARLQQAARDGAEAGWQLPVLFAPVVARPFALRHARAVLLGLLGVALVGLAGYVLGPFLQDAETSIAPKPAAVAAARGASIEVMPFEIAEPRGLATGTALARAVAAALVRFPDTVTFTPEAADAGAHGDYRLVASGAADADHLRVAVSLLETSTGRHVWSGDFETPAGWAAAAGTETVAARIANAVAGPRGAVFAVRIQEVEGVPVATATPYQCVLRYHVFWGQPSRARLNETQACLERAVTLDPGYATAHAHLALARLDVIRFHRVSFEQWPAILASAETAAKRAIELGPANPYAYMALHHVKWLQREPEQALVAGERALALNPADAETRANLGFRYAQRAEWERAVPLLEGAYAEAPELPTMYRQMLALHRYVSGRYEDALVEAKRIDLPEFPYTHVHRAINQAKLGQREQASASVQRLLAIDPGFPGRMAADLAARNIRPDLIRAIADGLRAAGLETAPLKAE